jgi:hypothetical protein
VHTLAFPLHFNPGDKPVPLQRSIISPRRSPLKKLGAPSSDFAFENAVIGQISPKSNLPCTKQKAGAKDK